MGRSNGLQRHLVQAVRGVAVGVDEQPDLIHERLVRMDPRRTAALTADKVEPTIGILDEDDRLRHAPSWHRPQTRGRTRTGDAGARS